MVGWFKGLLRRLGLSAPPPKPDKPGDVDVVLAVLRSWPVEGYSEAELRIIATAARAYIDASRANLRHAPRLFSQLRRELASLEKSAPISEVSISRLGFDITDAIRDNDCWRPS